jgi:hypothetical protein
MYMIHNSCSNPTSGFVDCNPNATYLPIGSVNNTGAGYEAPWSSHNYSQKAWDSYNRRFMIFAPNFNFFPLNNCHDPGNQSTCYNQVRASYWFDPLSKRWHFIAEDPDVGTQGSSATFDPINKKVVVQSHKYYTRDPGEACPQTFTMNADSYSWTRAGNNTGWYSFGSDLVYDRLNQRVLGYGCQFSGNCQSLHAYNVGTNTWTTVTTLGATHPMGAPAAAVDTKDNTMFTFGWSGDSGNETWQGLYRLDLTNNSWASITPSGADPFTTANAAQNSVTCSLMYDPTNNVIYLYRKKDIAGDVVGGWFSNRAEIWAYKPSAGDGAGVTGASGPPPQTSCTSN